MVVPPIVDEIRSLPAELHAFYMYLRQAMGPFAQGPVALIARHGDECVFSADALGLRPLWKLETPRRLHLQLRARRRRRATTWSPSRSRSGPGEKFMVTIDRDRAPLAALRARRDAARGRAALARAHRRRGGRRRTTARCETGGPLEGPEIPGYTVGRPSEPVKVEDRVLAGFGWQRDDVKLVPADGGQRRRADRLARLRRPARRALARSARTSPTTSRRRSPWSPTRRSTASARSSTSRPAPCSAAARRSTTRRRTPRTIETVFPVILGGHHDLAPLSRLDLPADRPRAPDLPARGPLGGVPRPRGGDRHRAARVRDHPGRDRAAQAGGGQRGRARAPSWSCSPTAPSTTASAATSTRIWRPRRSTRRSSSSGVEPGEENLRRRCSIVLRSAAIRNVHDVVLALGLGANGVCPYVMVEVICVDDYEQDVANLCAALRKGIEKVISTIGIHEVRGYARQFSSIGVKPELAEIFQTEAFAASERRRRRLRRARRRHRRAPRRSSPATRRRSRRRRSASTRRSTRRRSPRPTAPPATRSTRRRSASSRRRARSRCATSWSFADRSRAGRPGAGRRLGRATTTTRS